MDSLLIPKYPCSSGEYSHHISLKCPGRQYYIYRKHLRDSLRQWMERRQVLAAIGTTLEFEALVTATPETAEATDVLDEHEHGGSSVCTVDGSP